MDFITTDQRIAVENFTIGNIYTITFRNAIYFSGSCIGKGADFVSFMRTAPELSFVLTMQTAPTVLAITEGGGGTGTTDYNNLNNKPSINDVTLQGETSLTTLGIASIDEIQSINEIINGLTTWTEYEDMLVVATALQSYIDQENSSATVYINTGLRRAIAILNLTFSASWSGGSAAKVAEIPLIDYAPIGTVRSYAKTANYMLGIIKSPGVKAININVYDGSISTSTTISSQIEWNF